MENQSNNSNESPKTDQKTFLGMPMNWDWKNWHKDGWNPQDDRVFPPKRFGIGWGFNFHAALKKIKVIK